MQIPIIRDFIIEEIGRQKTYVESISDDRKRDWENLNDIFLKILGLVSIKAAPVYVRAAFLVFLEGKHLTSKSI